MEITEGLGIFFAKTGDTGTGLLDVGIVPKQTGLISKQHPHRNLGTDVFLPVTGQFQPFEPGKIGDGAMVLGVDVVPEAMGSGISSRSLRGR